MTPKEKALTICQAIGVTTLFDMKCHEGHTLPLHVSQKIAHIMVDELIEESSDAVTRLERSPLSNLEYWRAVKKQINLI